MRADRTLRIAVWEAKSSVGAVDRRTGLAILLVLLLIGALVPALVMTSPAPGADLYRVGVSESNEYHPVVEAEPELQAVDPEGTVVNGDSVDLRISGRTVIVGDSEKSKAAAGVFREAVLDYNTYLMNLEADRAAAFPVTVNLRYAQQSALEVNQGGPGSPGEEEPAGEPGTATADQPATDSDQTGVEDSPGGTESAEDTVDLGGEGTPQEGEDGTEMTESAPDGPAETATPPAQDQNGGIFNGGPLDGFFGTEQAGTPTSISPPFPLESLLLAFMFLLPFNFVIQAYGSSVIAERINRRGEPLLVSPATRGDIIVGKALPYFLGSVAITAVIAYVLGAGILSVAAITPLAALFIAATFLAGMLSRSYKELTFTTVTISVLFTGYAFLPAVFAEVHPIAAISPLTIVVHELQGIPIAWQTFLFATLPATFAAAVMFVFGKGIYREEDLFTQRPLPQKAIDAFAAPLTARWRVGLWTGLFIPFVLVAELLAVALLYLLPVELSIPILLGAIALIEEVAKSIHVFAGFERSRFEPGLRSAIGLGLISGVGFFLAEKVLAITQLVGLPNLEIGQAAFAPEVLGLTPALLLFAPLVLHTVTAAISAVGAERSRRAYVIAVLVASLVHLGYNLAVVNTLA